MFRTTAALSGEEFSSTDDVTEEVTTLVICQRTTKTSGYHTNDKRQIEILSSALEAARKIIAM